MTKSNRPCPDRARKRSLRLAYDGVMAGYIRELATGSQRAYETDGFSSTIATPWPEPTQTPSTP
jgi:hypothetical protein